MIVLGLDPGLANLGWCVMARGEPIAGGVFHTEKDSKAPSKGADKMRRADEIGAFLTSTLDVFRVGLVSHEGISLGFHQATTLLDMGIAFGALAAACSHLGVRRVEVGTGLIKAWAMVQAPSLPHNTEEERLRARVAELEAGNKGPVISAVRSRWPALFGGKTDDWQHLADAAVAAVLSGTPKLPGSNDDGIGFARQYRPETLSGAVRSHLPALPKRKRGEPVPAYSPSQVRAAALPLVKP
jgi:Holliday junction resolvasome RuvABC endonuclease subunit